MQLETFEHWLIFDNIKNIIVNFGGEGTWINFKETYSGYF